MPVVLVAVEVWGGGTRRGAADRIANFDRIRPKFLHWFGARSVLYRLLSAVDIESRAWAQLIRLKLKAASEATNGSGRQREGEERRAARSREVGESFRSLRRTLKPASCTLPSLRPIAGFPPQTMLGIPQSWAVLEVVGHDTPFRGP